MGCHCFKSQQSYPDNTNNNTVLQQTSTQDFSQRSASTNRDMKLKYMNLIQSETTNIKKNLILSQSSSPSMIGVNNSDQSLKQAQWLKYIKKELSTLSDEVDWAYPLLTYIKTSFKIDKIQLVTYKLLSDFFWAQYQESEMTSPALIKLKSPKQEHNQNQLLTQENKSIFLSPKVINSQKNRHTVMSPEPVKNFSQQLELKAQDQKSIQNHHKSVKLTLKSQIIDENGQDALRLSSKFNRRVLIIRDQISDNKSHPLHKLIKRFDNLFFHQYAPQIERTNQKFVMKDSKEVMNRIVREVQSFVRILFFATIKFYRIELKPNDIRKDLIINMLTSVIIHKFSITYENYFISILK